MPIYDFVCPNEECEMHDQDIELLCNVGDFDQECETCTGKLRKVYRSTSYKKVPHISWSTWRVGMGGNS